MTGITVAVTMTGTPVMVTLALLVACCLPLRRPSGGMVRNAVEGIGLGLVRAVVGLGLHVAVSVAGAVLEVAASRAAQASMDQAAPAPRGPERGAQGSRPSSPRAG